MEVFKICDRTAVGPGISVRELWSLMLKKAYLRDQQCKEVNCECCTWGMGQVLKYNLAACKGLCQDQAKVNFCLPVLTDASVLAWTLSSALSFGSGHLSHAGF